jgi:hypothetical protein
MFPIRFSINNGALNSIKAMPQKDSTSDGQSSFVMGRQTYIKTMPDLTKPVQARAHKKWLGNRDASQVTANRRNAEMGIGSLNANSNLMAFTTYKDVNNVNDALRRVRAGGAVAPPKKAANLNNAPTPTFSPAIPPADIRGIKYPTMFH